MLRTSAITELGRRRRMARLMWILLFCLVLPDLGAEALSGPNLSSVFQGKGRIAIVELSGGKQRSFEHDGKRFVCGRSYSATVVESLRGGTEPFEFIDTGGGNAYYPFEEAKDNRWSPGRYLVFVSMAPRSKTRHRVEDDEAAFRTKRAACVKQFEYFTHSTLQMVFPIIQGCGDDQDDEHVQELRRSILDVIDESPDAEAQIRSYCLQEVKKNLQAVLEDIHPNPAVP